MKTKVLVDHNILLGKMLKNIKTLWLVPLGEEIPSTLEDPR